MKTDQEIYAKKQELEEEIANLEEEALELQGELAGAVLDDLNTLYDKVQVLQWVLGERYNL